MRRPALFVTFFIAATACLGMALRGSTYAASFRHRNFVSASPELRSSLDQIGPEDLHGFYQQINQDSFDGKLPDVPVSWGDLTEADAYGITRFNRGTPYLMELDRQTVRSKSFALDVIRHESCHIATNHEAKQRKEDPHGPTFTECMARIQNREEND